MGYDHSTVGFDKFDQLKLKHREWLEQGVGELIVTDYSAHYSTCGWADPSKGPVCEHMRRLRIAVFRDHGSKELMVAEEWLGVEDRDCDGTDVVKLAVYRLGHRPRLIKQVKPA